MLDIIRNARVEAAITEEKGAPCLQITVEDRYVHVFSPNSRESRLLAEANLETIRQMLNGGHFVFTDGKLVDYRGSEYRGYVQSDDAVEQLQEHIGFEKPRAKGQFSEGTRGLFEGVRGRKTNGAIFGGEGDPFDLEVPDMGTGGEFSGHIVFGWSVFSDKVVTSLNVKRLVCENGMVADAPFVTYEVPIINKWRENLDVVNQLLKPTITETLNRRFAQMDDQSASLADVMRAHEIIRKRAASEALSERDKAHLKHMEFVLDPEIHLHNVYRESTYTNRAMAARVDAHLSQFDVFNILTEANSHYGRELDSDADANRLVNRLVFDEFKARNAGNFTLKPSDESDHRRAFFGKA